MNARLVNIPAEAILIPAWLEQELMSLHLRELVQELQVVHAAEPLSASERRTIEEWLGAERASVLSQGLSGISTSRIRELLGQPELLLDLQELVLLEGGPHWQQLLEQSKEVEAKVKGFAESLVSPPPARSLFRSPLTWMLVTAAAVLLMVGIQNWPFTPPVAQPGWGWNAKTLAEAHQKPAAEYLRTLADGGEQWSKKTPATSEALAQRIRELRTGCDQLIASDHPPLTAEDRAWLLERCRAWRDKFDEQLNLLEQGTDHKLVQANMDGIVTQLVAKIRERAEQVAG